MVVVLPNRQLLLRARAHSFPRDAHGQPVAPGVPGAVRGPYPGSALEGATPDDVWSIRLDPRMLPVEPADEVTDGTLVWVVASARHVYLPGYPAADYVAVTGILNPPEVP